MTNDFELTYGAPEQGSFGGVTMPPEGVDQIDQIIEQQVVEISAEQLRAWLDASQKPEAQQIIQEMKAAKLGQLGDLLAKMLSEDKLQYLLSNDNAEKEKPEKEKDQNERDLERLSTELKKIQTGLLENVTSEVTSIFQSETDLDKRMARLRARLSKLHFPNEVVEELMIALSADGMTAEKAAEMVQTRLNTDHEPLVGSVPDIERVRQEYPELLQKVRDLREEDSGNRDKVIREGVTSVSQTLIDSLDVPGFIDIFFAAERGYGSFRGGDYKAISEQKDEEKERQTLKVLGKILDNETGSGLFFVSLTQKTESELFASNQLLRELGNVFAPLEQKRPEDYIEVKRKIAKAVEDSAAIPELFGVKIKAEEINLSENVLRYILIMAKARIKKNEERPTEGERDIEKAEE